MWWESLCGVHTTVCFGTICLLCFMELFIIILFVCCSYVGNITYEFGIYFCHVPVNEQVNEVVNDNGTLEVDEVYVSDEDVSLMKQGILLELYIHIQTGIKLFLEFFSIYLF